MRMCIWSQIEDFIPSLSLSVDFFPISRMQRSREQRVDDLQGWECKEAGKCLALALQVNCTTTKKMSFEVKSPQRISPSRNLPDTLLENLSETSPLRYLNHLTKLPSAWWHYRERMCASIQKLCLGTYILTPEFRETLESPFSAVSIPIFASNYEACSIFRDLQISHTFGSL